MVDARQQLVLLGDLLAEKVHVYSKVLANPNASVPTVINAMEAVRQAADEFTQVSVVLTGWGSPFVTPKDGSGTAEDESVSRPQLVHLRVEYDLACDDPRLATQIAIQRARKSGLTIPMHEMDTVVGAVQTLESIDGWNPESYRVDGDAVFRVTGKEWSSTPG